MAFLTAPLPGLYLAALAAALAWALRRWWDPLPRRVWALFGALLVILFGPALFLGRVLVPGDILPGIVTPERVGAPPEGNVLQLDLVTQIVPWQAQVRRALRAGEWPLWNDRSGAGMPLLADPQSQVFQPLVLVALPLPLPQALTVTAGLRVLLALVFLFLLLRRQGLSEGAALFGSVSFGLGGYLLLWLSWPMGNSPALLPLVLYALVMTDERGARRDFLLLIAALFALATGGHPETILYLVLVGTLFGIARLLRRPGRERWDLAGRWLLAGALAAGLAAPMILPALRFLPQTHRSHMLEIRNQRLEGQAARGEVRAEAEREGTLEGARERFVSAFAPNAFGNSRWGHYWGAANTNEDAGGFVGGAALLAALLAFAPARRRYPQERLFLGLGVASFLMSIRVPGVPQVLAALPGLDQSITLNRRLLLVMAFSLAYLAACSVDRWRRGEGPHRGLTAAAGLVLLGLIVWGYRLSPSHTELLGLRHFWMIVQLAVVAATALVLLLPRGRRMAWGLIGVAVLELMIFHRPANPSLPRETFYPVTPVLGFLQEHAGAYRVAGLGGQMLPNAAAVYGLADVRISSPFKPFSYVLALAPVSPGIRSTEHLLVKPEHPLYQLLAVRYLLGPPKMKSGPGWKAVFRDSSTRVFERQQVLERFFLPRSTRSDAWPAWRRFLSHNPDFAALTLVEPSPGKPEKWTAARPDESTLQAQAGGPDRVSLRILLAEDRLLASSLYQDGGWTLLVEGRPHPLTLSNGPFLAAWLPSGEHHAELLYRAPGFLPGLLLAALALVGLLIWVVPLPSADRPGRM